MALCVDSTVAYTLSLPDNIQLNMRLPVATMNRTYINTKCYPTFTAMPDTIREYHTRKLPTCNSFLCINMNCYIVYGQLQLYNDTSDPLNKNAHCSHNPIFFSALSTVFKEWVFKIQLNQATSFEVIALDSKVSKKIDLYSSHTENKLQVLTFAAITFVCICLQCWDLA